MEAEIRFQKYYWESTAGETVGDIQSRDFIRVGPEHPPDTLDVNAIFSSDIIKCLRLYS